MDINNKEKWQPLRELAIKTPYTMEYLSLMARRKQLKVKKVGRLWFSTLEAIRDFEDEMKERKQKRKEKMRNSYFKKADKQPNVKVRVSEDTIFNQIQRELEEVLHEIREKERRLRDDYKGMSSENVSIKFHTNPVGDSEEAGSRSFDSSPGRLAQDDNSIEEEQIKQVYLHKEKQETEELSEKLIMDLGRLLNTANQIQEDAATSVEDISGRSLAKGERAIKEIEEFKIPITNKREAVVALGDKGAISKPECIDMQASINKKEDSENHTPFLSLNYPSHARDPRESIDNRKKYYDSYGGQAKRGRWWNAILVFLITFLIMISIVLVLFLVYA